jgi:hypothetical protein
MSRTHEEQYRDEYLRELDTRIKITIQDLEMLFRIARNPEASFQAWYIQKFPDKK